MGAAAALWPSVAMAQDSSGGNAAGGAIGFAFLCCYGIVILVFLALFVFWIWMLIDLIKRPETQFEAGMNKTVWLVLMIVSLFFSLYWVVALIYYFMIYRKLGKA